VSAPTKVVPPVADQRSAREEARDFLLQTLEDGPKPQLEVQAEASKLHISVASLRRAKGDLGIRPRKTADHWECGAFRPWRRAPARSKMRRPRRVITLRLL
jgi:hypothetical protein